MRRSLPPAWASSVSAREQVAAERERRGHLGALVRERVTLEGERAAAAAAVTSARTGSRRAADPAPVDGRLGEIAPLQVGAVIREGERLASIVRPGANQGRCGVSAARVGSCARRAAGAAPPRRVSMDSVRPHPGDGAECGERDDERVVFGSSWIFNRRQPRRSTRARVAWRRRSRGGARGAGRAPRSARWGTR